VADKTPKPQRYGKRLIFVEKFLFIY